jgi:hypothetical protein
MTKSIEEILKKEAPEQTVKQMTEALQELEIYFCKTAEGKRFWKKKGRRIKSDFMRSNAELSDNNNLIQKNTPKRY